jgi:hypothetical protein
VVGVLVPVLMVARVVDGVLVVNPPLEVLGARLSHDTSSTGSG